MWVNLKNQKFNYHGQIQFLINLVQLLLYTLHKVSTNGTVSGSRLVQSQGVVTAPGFSNTHYIFDPDT